MNMTEGLAVIIWLLLGGGLGMIAMAALVEWGRSDESFIGARDAISILLVEEESAGESYSDAIDVLKDFVKRTNLEEK